MTDSVAFPQGRICPHQPAPGYRPLTARGPLAQVTLYDGRRVWAVTTRDLARRLLIDPRISSDRTNPAWPAMVPIVAAAVGDAQQKVLKIVTALVGVDDPVHKARRRMLIPSFTFRRINALRPKIQEIVDQQLDHMIKNGAPTDLIPAFAAPVPVTVLYRLMGIPDDDHGSFEKLSHQLAAGPNANEAYDQLMDYMGTLIAEKRRNPGEGVLDDLLAKRGATGDVDHDELVSTLVLQVAGGHGTTGNMIALGMFALLQHPERLAELRADPSLMPTAVDELLRFLSVPDGVTRLAADDIEVDGTTIRKGDGVFFITSLINRDTDVHDAPNSLDWHRASAADHLTFGFGAHQCLGQSLARITMEIALGTLIDRLPSLRLAVPAEDVSFLPAASFQVLTELPVTW
ncbi:cytochrome P450 [Micromonospora sp. WMMA1363]|uniref:cytochrome P450 n=1 Tax=Micromonospora sp. WMMA1363 TaxID=3053985 RepID=UPI00259CF45D|nr:cytochrome P450 [Micromonospora sp. WMMA1363]MDM4721016.1 cytochrome P450 [Micromonospora sp. WMMA1363]